MKSKHILILHTTLFFTFVSGSILASVIMVFFPELFSPKYLFFGTLVLMGLIVGSWSLFGGCPFTKWENYYREREQLGSSYSGPCILMYSKKWFNIDLPKRFDVYIPIAFLVLPLIIALLN